MGEWAYLVVSVVVVGPHGFHQLGQGPFVLPEQTGGLWVSASPSLPPAPHPEQDRRLLGSKHKPFASDTT